MNNQYIPNKMREDLRESYINDINDLMSNCHDISLFDLIKRLLEKSI